MQRRRFLQTTSLATAGILLSPAARAARTGRELPFTLSLKADAIGIDGSVTDLIDLAIRHGYTAVSVPGYQLTTLSDAEIGVLAARAGDAGLQWGSSGLPVEFRGDEERFRADLEAMKPQLAKLAALGVDRIATWIMPCHDERSYRTNFDLHADRLGRTAEGLRAQGDFRLGLEYVGPQTLRFSQQYTFIHNGRQLRELLDAIGDDRAGVVLDSFHWYTAGETVEDLDEWSASEIIAVDLNDAGRGLSREGQMDNMRELPGATGKIDLKAFLTALAAKEYDGPVRCEPFNATLESMEAELAAAAAIAALRRSVATVE